MDSIESIVSVCNFSKQTYSPAVIQLKPENISLINPQNSHAFKHVARYVITYWTLKEERDLQTQHRTTLFSSKLTFLPRPDGN